MLLQDESIYTLANQAEKHLTTKREVRMTTFDDPTMTILIFPKLLQPLEKTRELFHFRIDPNDVFEQIGV